MNKIILTLVAGAAVAGFAAQGIAGEANIKHDMFAAIDQNSDGNVSTDEVTSWFGMLDANTDGQVTEEEFTAEKK